MVRSLILATAVSLCLSNHWVADAVRKVHVVDPAEAKKQELEKERQAMLEANKRLRLTVELVRKQREIWFQLQRETNQESRERLQLQLDELKLEIQHLRETGKAARK